MQQAVAGEGEGIDLDLGLLPRMHEADIAVRDHRLDLEPAVLRNDDGEHLRRHHHAADRVHAELLHHAVDRRREELQLGPAFGLDDVPAERGNLLIGLGEIVEQSAAALGRDPVARLLQRRRGCIDLAHLAALDDEVLLHSDEVLVFGEVGQLGAELLPVEIFAQIDTLLQHRDGRLELPDHRNDARALRLLLRLLAIDLGKLAVELGALGNKELPLHLGLLRSSRRAAPRCRSFPRAPRVASRLRARPRRGRS